MHIKSQSATVALVLACTLWGLSWIPLKFLSRSGVDGLLLIFICYLTMFVLLLPLLLRSMGNVKGHLMPLLGIFFVGGAANLCFNYAFIHGEVVRVMVLFYLLPVWGVIGGRFILKERTDAWRWAGVVLAVCGAFILLGGNTLLSQPPKWIDLIALLSGFFLAGNNMLFRAVEQVPLTLKLGALFLGCFTIAGVMVLMGAGGATTSISWQGIGLCVAYAVFWLLWANLGSQWAVTQMPAGRSSIIIITELIAAVVSAIAIGGEELSTQVLVGGALVLSATAIEVLRADAPAAKPASPT